MFNNKLKNIDINKIQANENQPRTVFNEEKIEELAASIKENGLIQPIVVRKVNGIYQIIAGERRYRACCSLNMKQIPCIIEDYDDKQTQTLAIIENIQREDLSPLEEAKAYQALIKEYGYSQTELADIVGKKQSTIANKLRLLKLSDDVKFSLNQKQITERHARAMLSLNEEKQQEVLREVLKKKLTVADTERLIKKEPKPKKKSTRKIVLLSLIFSLLMIALVSFVAMAMFGNKYEETPDVIGKSVKEAEQIFNKNNLKLGKISRSYSDKYPENESINTTPNAG